MKFFPTKLAVVSVGLALLAACSGGGKSTPDANTMTVGVNSQGAVFVADSSNSIMSAHTSTVDNKTIIQICSDIDADNDCSKTMIVTIDGTETGKHAMDSVDSPSQIMFHDDALENGVIKHYISNSGEIEVIENDGSAVVGNYKAILECNSGCTGTITVAGAFNIPVTP